MTANLEPVRADAAPVDERTYVDPARYRWSIAVGCVALAALQMLSLSCASQQFPMVRAPQRATREHDARIRAEEYFLKARDYDRRGLPQMAESFYKLALDLDPSSHILRELLAEKYVELSKYTQALLTIKDREASDSLTEKEGRLLATAYLKLGQFARAAELLEKIQDKSAGDLYSLALLNESAGDLERALGYYRLYFDQTGRSADVGVKIVGVLLKQRRFGAAESLLVDLETRFGQSAQLLNLLGVTNLSKGDTTQAVGFLKLALIADSTHEEALRNVAQIYIQRSQFDQAIPYYRALYRIPYWGEVYGKTLGLLYYYTNRYSEAQDLFGRLLAGNVDDYELHYYLGLVAQAQDNGDLARLEFEKAIAINTTWVDPWRQLCYLSLSEKNHAQALRDAQRFVAAVESNSLSWRTLGTVYGARREYAAAESAFAKAVVVDSSDASAWFELGGVLERQKLVDRASIAFRKVLALRPADAVAANYLGYMWAEQKTNLDSAQLLLEMALGKEPDNGAFLDSYAWIFFQKGDIQRAAEYLVKAMEKITDDPVIFEHWGDILAAKEDTAGAVHAYRRSLELNPENRDAILKKISDLSRPGTD